MYDLIGSIVLYRNPPEQVQQAISSFLNTSLSVRLYVVDNSATDAIRTLCDDRRITYTYNGRNVGFGAGHNMAIRASEGEAEYRVILNPDVYFGPGVLERLLLFARSRPEIGLVMPKILNPDGSLQHLCKRLPSPGDLIFRRFLPNALRPWIRDRLARYELRDQDYSRILCAPCLSGCFMLINNAALAEVGIFDERYFLYLEDVDLCRRIHQKFETIYYPRVSIYHHNGKSSYRELRPLIYHVVSAFRYFQKWGWYSDHERVLINERVAARPITPRAAIKFKSAPQD
jgi:GT2 family glycosyltransferase